MSRSTRCRVRNAGIAAVLVGLLAFGTGVPAMAAVSVDDPNPDRVVLTPAQDPATSQSFTWRTGADVTTGKVSIRVAGSSDDWRVVDAYQNDPLDGENGFEVRTHSATVDGLQPNTEYEYFVGNDDAKSETWKFTTAGTPGDPFTFLYFGDAQNRLSETWGTAVKAGFEHYPDAIGTVNAGDLINRSNSSEWTEWFDGMDGYSQTTNVIAAPGNHEYTDDSFLTHWKSNFEYPANGPKFSGDEGSTAAEQQEAAYRAHMADVLTETVYFTDYQGVRFISLNASRSQARPLFTPDNLPDCLIGCPDPVEIWLDMQAQWLDRILENNPNEWAVATFHQPVFSTAVGRDEADLRAAWLPVFQRNDIDLVLMGHDHTYARGYVNDDATGTDGVTTGPVYTVAVAGPKYYDQQPVDDNVWTQNGATQVIRAGHTSTVQGITVDGGTLRYEAMVVAKWDGEEESTTDISVGEMLDSFTITKYPNGEKYVTEDGVEIPGPSDVSPVDPAPTDPTDPELAPEFPAEEPADAPLAHVLQGTLTSPTVEGPVVFDDGAGILYVGDASEDGLGRIEAIDVANDEVLRSFEVGAPVTAMSFTPAEGGLLLVGAAGENGARANGYAVNPAFFGAPALEDDVPMDATIRGVSIDPGSMLVYFALEQGAVAVVDLDEGSPVGVLPVGPGLHGVKVDEATGNVYISADQADGTSELSIYRAGLKGEPIGEYTLEAGAEDIDLDTAAGLAYVSHTDGLSAVDVLAEEVTYERLDAGVLSLATSPSAGRIYVSSDDGVLIVTRAHAPRITESPVAVTIEAGESATLTAAATAVPEATVQWQVRDGDEWSDIEGETATELTVSPDETAIYRALFSNEIAGGTFSTGSASATVTVLQAAPGDDDSDAGSDTDAGADDSDVGAADDSDAGATDGDTGESATDIPATESETGGLAQTGASENLLIAGAVALLLLAIGGAFLARRARA